MPDTIVAPPSELQPPANHDPADSYRQFFSDDGTLKQPAAEPEVPKHDAAPPEAKTTPPPAKTDDGIPDQFLTDKKHEPPPVDEFTEMVKEAPKGQIAHERFVKLQELSKQRIEAAAKERDELRAELDKVRGNKGVSEDVQKEIESLRKRADEAEAELERTAYERTPKFKERFVEPENRLRESVKGIGKEYNLEPGDVEDLMSLKGRRRDEMIEGLEISSAAKQRLVTELSHLDRLANDRDTELSRSREQLRAAHEEMQRTEKVKEERARAEEDRIFSDRLEVAKSKLPGFMRVEGNEAWNREVEAREQYAKEFFNGKVAPEEMTDVILQGMNAKVQEKMITKLKAQVATLSEQVTKLNAAGPGGGQPPGGPSHEEGGKHDPGTTYNRFINAARQQEGNQFAT